MTTEEQKTRQERAENNVQQFFDFKERIQSEAYKPIRTGLGFYDELMDGGAMAQTLTILLAEQGAGKTMLMQQLAESIAAQKERRVIYMNFEMSAEQLLARAISARIYKRGNMKKNAKDILRGYKWNDKERAEILEAVDEYEREALPYISYNPQGIKPVLEDLESYLDELSSWQSSPVLFVDYLQLIQGNKNQEIKDRLTQALIDLKRYAMENNTVVYLISAINRPSGSNSNDNITANRARDTSAIEYQADYLLALQNAKDQAIANENSRQRMMLKLIKSRDGKSGVYSMIQRDGYNNLFVGEYKGDGAEPYAIPEDPDDDAVQYAF